MTRQTFRVVVSSILFDWLVRIMARSATDASIIGVTLAVENAIRLKPHIIDFQAKQLLKVGNGAMTSGTKLLR